MKRYIFIIAFFITTVIPQRALAEDVTVIVKGMVCSFCAQGLKRTFEKRPEVKGIDVNLDTKVVTIELNDGKQLEDAEIEQLIKDAGYDVLRIDREKNNG